MVTKSLQEDIDYFCYLCDHKTNEKICPGYDKGKYVERDECGWSFIQEIHVRTTRETIGVGNVEYQRGDMVHIMEAIKKEKLSRLESDSPFN